MPPNPRVVQAFRAMKGLGISEEKVKPSLKSLLKLYDKNWDLIEEENYRILVDAIFENEEAEEAKKKKPASNEIQQEQEEAEEPDEMEQPLKRSRLRYQQGQPMQSNSSSSSQLAEILPNMKDELELLNGDRRTEAQRVNSHPFDPSKRKQPASPNSLVIQEIPSSSNPVSVDKCQTKETSSGEIGLVTGRSSHAVHFEEPRTEDGLPSASSLTNARQGSIQSEVPIAMVNPGTDREPEKVPGESSSQLQIASSSSGEVKLSLSYNISTLGSNFHVPSIDEVVKAVEDKCLRTYKILDPNFSVLKVMEDMCECLFQLKSEKSQTETQITSNVELSSFVHPSVATQIPYAANVLPDAQPGVKVTLPHSLRQPPPFSRDDCFSRLFDNASKINQDHLEIELNVNGSKNDKSLVCVQQHQLASDDARPLNFFVDICNGQESVAISLVNEVNNEYPPSFYYIPQSVVFQNAYVNFSLARIEDAKSCSICSGNCLSLPTPCACAHETGGEFAYTVEGLVKEEFIEECISMNRDPKKHCQYFCKECPLERSKKEDVIEPCKGHLVRKFIKECWWKCDCDKQCGNRVAQRGITRNLQVFMTIGKGWGLRTLEDLPKGTFVCEYVGEILTSAERFDRVSKSHKGEEHSYPVLLDADWGSEGVLKDEEALCLDATKYGNVARFINHRCFDSNLVEIPVEIETPDHHYYHLAFFTTREVKAMEELTWDRGSTQGGGERLAA